MGKTVQIKASDLKLLIHKTLSSVKAQQQISNREKKASKCGLESLFQ